MIIMNDQMKKIISCFNINETPKYSSPILFDLINPNFVEVKDCILRIKPNEKNKDIKIDLIYSTFIDKTGFEAFESHIHVIDYIDEFRYGLFEGLMFFMQLTQIWGKKLKETFPQYKFHIVLSYDKKDCVLRFHRLRNDESPWIDIENLNNYKYEAILVEAIWTECNV